jgi:hypothetical protein
VHAGCMSGGAEGGVQGVCMRGGGADGHDERGPEAGGGWRQPPLHPFHLGKLGGLRRSLCQKETPQPEHGRLLLPRSPGCSWGAAVLPLRGAHGAPP